MSEKKRGNPRINECRPEAAVAIKAKADKFAWRIKPIIEDIMWFHRVESARGIARLLNKQGVKTARGGKWTAVQVGAIKRRVPIQIKKRWT